MASHSETNTAPLTTETTARRDILWLLGAGTATLLILSIAALSGHLGGRDLLFPLGLLLMVVLAFANGGNDVSKAIATLVGSGVTNYRRALIWGSLWTVAGCVTAAWIATGLVSTFTKGIIDAQATLTDCFALAVLVGAVGWVFLATRFSLPVSTTHAITGGIVTVGGMALGFSHIKWASLVGKIALPLLLSPVLALVLAIGVYFMVRLALARFTLNAVHWLSSGAASFTRGLNDTPKIAALGVFFLLITTSRGTAPSAQITELILAAGLGMGIGSLLGGLRVTKTLAERVTKVNSTEGFAANVTTAVLVALASPLGLPVSTTHVSSCAMIGVGLREGSKRINWPVVRAIVLAWIITLPGAGLLGAIAFFLLHLVTQR